MNTRDVPSPPSRRGSTRHSSQLPVGIPATLFWSLCFLLLSITAVWSQEVDPNTDAVLTAPALDILVVQLQDPPVAAYGGGKNGMAGTQPPPGQRLNLNSAAAKAYLSFLTQEQQIFTK